MRERMTFPGSPLYFASVIDQDSSSSWLPSAPGGWEGEGNRGKKFQVSPSETKDAIPHPKRGTVPLSKSRFPKEMRWMTRLLDFTPRVFGEAICLSGWKGSAEWYLSICSLRFRGKFGNELWELKPYFPAEKSAGRRETRAGFSDFGNRTFRFKEKKFLPVRFSSHSFVDWEILRTMPQRSHLIGNQ